MNLTNITDKNLKLKLNKMPRTETERSILNSVSSFGSLSFFRNADNYTDELFTVSGTSHYKLNDFVSVFSKNNPYVRYLSCFNNF